MKAKIMKTTLLTAIIMMSMFSFAAIASPSDYFFTQDLLGEAGIVSGAGLGHSGDYAVRLYIPGPHVNDDDAKLRIPYTGTLESLETFSFWTKVVGTDGELHPYGSLNIDSDEDPDIDYVVVQWEVGSYPPTGADVWIQTVWDDDTRIHVVSSHLGWGELPDYGQQDANTFGNLRQELGWADYDVTQVKVAVGMWTHAYPIEGFVDDVQVNDVTYTFEPEPEVWVNDDADPDWYVNPAHFATIQEGITGVVEDGTVNVAAGTYTEQVNIEKSMTITGAGQASTHIVSPDPTTMIIYDLFGSKGLNQRYSVHRGTNIPVVRIVASDVTFEGFHIDLADKEFFDVQGSFEIDTTYSKGVGILVDHVETTPGTPDIFTGITIQDNTVDGLLWDDYSDCIKVMASAIVDINNNILYGYGESAVAAQGMDNPRAAFYSTVTANDNTIYGGSGARSGNHYFFGVGYWSGATGSADGNTIYNAPNGNGYALNSWTPNPVSFTNNIILTDGGTVGGYGAQLYESSNLIFSGNDIQDQGLAGAIWKGGGTGITITITNNEIINCIDGFIGDGLTAGSVTLHQNNFEGTFDHFALDMSGNDDSIWGSADPSTITADATLNYWGTSDLVQIEAKVTGPVNFDPWLGASITGAKSKEVTGGTPTDPITDIVDAIVESDIEIEYTATGDTSISVSSFEENPEEGFSNDAGKYYDVYVEDPAAIESLTLRFYYTDVDLGGRDESTLSMLWHDESSWKPVSHQTLHTVSDVSGYSGYIEVYVATVGTTPQLSQMTGTPFGFEGEWPEVADERCELSVSGDVIVEAAEDVTYVYASMGETAEITVEMDLAGYHGDIYFTLYKKVDGGLAYVDEIRTVYGVELKGSRTASWVVTQSPGNYVIWINIDLMEKVQLTGLDEALHIGPIEVIIS